MGVLHPCLELIITEDGGVPVTLRPGDSFIIRDGFSGTWEAPVTARKRYVVHFPKKAAPIATPAN